MNEEIELLKTVTTRLNSAGIEYMITGSIALALYSTPRMTRDIDIIIKVSLKDVSKIIEQFGGDFYIDQDSVYQAILNRGMFNIIHNDTVIKVDFIVIKNEEYRIEEFSRRQETEIGGILISVVAPEDLILSKLVWAKGSESEFQLRDVKKMMASIENLDKKYIEKWVEELGVKHLLKKVLDNE